MATKVPLAIEREMLPLFALHWIDDKNETVKVVARAQTLEELDAYPRRPDRRYAVFHNRKMLPKWPGKRGRPKTTQVDPGAKSGCFARRSK